MRVCSERSDLAGAERFGDVVVRAQFQAQHSVHFLGPRCEHDDGNPGALAYGATDVQAAQAGEH